MITTCLRLAYLVFLLTATTLATAETRLIHAGELRAMPGGFQQKLHTVCSNTPWPCAATGTNIRALREVPRI